jgi:hypothetical protein
MQKISRPFSDFFSSLYLTILTKWLASRFTRKFKIAERFFLGGVMASEWPQERNNYAQ